MSRSAGFQRERVAAWRRDEAGFSLAELLVVVVIVGLAALVVVPNANAMFRAYRVRAASDQLVRHLRAARQIAVTQRLPVTFTVTPSPNPAYSFSYTITGQPATTQTYPVPERIAVTNTPGGSLSFTIRQNGTVENPTTPDDQSPTANYVTVSAPIASGVTDTYTISLLAAGKVGVKFTR